MNGKDKKNKNILLRTISNRGPNNYRYKQILEFMTHESKNIYNISIFHTQIYFFYYHKIFKKLYKLVKAKEITSIGEFDTKLFEIYGKYYQDYLIIKPYKKFNNDLIYNTIKKKLSKTYLANDNYYSIEKSIIKLLERRNSLKFPKNASDNIKKQLFQNIVSSILQSIYKKNYNKTKEEILDKKKCSIDDKIFINQVKNNEYLLDDQKTNTKYKLMIKKHKLFQNLPKKQGIKSDQNYISRIVYKYYTNPKIPSDLMCNIIVKAHQAYSSFFALKKKGIRANIPKFLERNGTYILPFYQRSRKEIKFNGKSFYRLTVGLTISDYYTHIIDDTRYICINQKQNKLYIHQNDLIPITNNMRITKKDNYIIGNYYIHKKSKKIINSNYIYVKKPKNLKCQQLKLIEIVPLYNGFDFKINYVYETKKSKNKPKKGKMISVDLGMKNLMAIYNPKGEQYLINGSAISGMNKYYNYQINKNKSLLAKRRKRKKIHDEYIKEINAQVDYINGKNLNYVPKRITDKDYHQQKIKAEYDYIQTNGRINNTKEVIPKTSKRIRRLLIARENKINDYFNKIVKWFINKYKECKQIIIGYNKGWKTNVNMGRKLNGDFYQIPYSKLIGKLKNKLEENNQKLIIINESYTSKCDALALESIEKHSKYTGKRTKRGLFSSSTGVLLNADINGAINIMRKYKQRKGKKMEEIKGINLCNPKKINVHEALCQ